MDEDDYRTQINLISALAGIIAGAIIVAIYYLLASGCCHLRRVGEAPQRSSTSQDTRASNNLTRAPRVPLTPSVSYVKEYENKETCSVCLCDFNEGERIRVLPECLHLFHVDCIDKWLHCHPNCPVCRAASSAPPILVLPAEGSGGARSHEIIHHQVILVDG